MRTYEEHRAVCNLYRMTHPRDEVAKWFKARPAEPSNAGEEVYPGYPGFVIAEGRMQQMTWGFPLVLMGKKGQPLKPKAVNNAREDKLLTNMWRNSFENRRCLIPVSAFAEAEGPKGMMTRTWLSVPGDEPFVCAGIWRLSAEWGPVYSMVMTEPCDISREVHDRMPVILAERDRVAWVSGQPDEALALCVPWKGDLIIDRTDVPWVKR